MFCNNCGAKLNDNSKFCENCGAQVQSGQNNVQNQAQQNTQNVQNTAQNQYQTINSGQTLEGILTLISTKMDIILAFFANLFFKKGHGFNEVASAGSKSPIPVAKVLTPSCQMDLSGIEREYTKSAQTKLGGFLAFVVYAGLICVCVMACFLIYTIIMHIITLFSMLGTMYGTGIVAFIIGVILVLFDIVLAVVSVSFAFRFFTKIKNRELDFLHFYYKALLWLLICFGVYDALYIVEMVLQIIAVSGNIMAAAFSATTIFANSLGIIYCLASLFGNIIATLLSSVLVTAYFGKSKRVRTYMGTDAYLRLSQFSRTMLAPVPDKGTEDLNIDVCSTKGRFDKTAFSSAANNVAYKVGTTVASASNAAKKAADSAKESAGSAYNAAQESAAAAQQGIKDTNSRVCKNCGYICNVSDKFCPECGQEIN